MLISAFTNTLLKAMSICILIK